MCHSYPSAREVVVDVHCFSLDISAETYLRVFTEICNSKELWYEVVITVSMNLLLLLYTLL